MKRTDHAVEVLARRRGDVLAIGDERPSGRQGLVVLACFLLNHVAVPGDVLAVDDVADFAFTLMCIAVGVVEPPLDAARLRVRDRLRQLVERTLL